MKNFIDWQCANQPLFPVTPIKIEYRVSPERIVELEKADPEIDWSVISHKLCKLINREMEC